MGLMAIGHFIRDHVPLIHHDDHETLSAADQRHLDDVERAKSLARQGGAPASGVRELEDEWKELKLTDDETKRLLIDLGCRFFE